MDGECCSKYHQTSHVVITRSDVEHLLSVTKCLLKYAKELLAEKNAKDFQATPYPCG